MNKNKKGQSTIFMILLLVISLLGAIFLLVGGIIVVKMSDALSQDVDIGQVNLATLNEDYFGKYETMVLTHADWWGLSLIFGMIMGLFLSSYFMRGRFPKWAIILDIFIILAIFIASIYISSSYQIILDAFSEAGEPFLETNTPKTSMFILNLPIFIVIIGVIMMVLMHSSIPRKREEVLQSGGTLRGI